MRQKRETDLYRCQKDLAVVLEYLWHDEELHYLVGPSRDHIFNTLRRLAKTIGFKRR